MNDDELDARLRTLGDRPVSPGAASALDRLAADALAESRRPVAPPRSRRVHVSWALGLTAAALALTAGTTATAYYLGVPPFVSLGKHELRTSESIPLRFETRNDIEIRCLIFLDFTHTSQAQVDQVDEAIRDRDWSDFGQDLYDAHPELPDAPSLAESLNPQDPIGDEAFDAAFDLAAQVIPALRARHAHVDTGDPMVTGIDMTCRPDAQ